MRREKWDITTNYILLLCSSCAASDALSSSPFSSVSRTTLSTVSKKRWRGRQKEQEDEESNSNYHNKNSKDDKYDGDGYVIVSTKDIVTGIDPETMPLFNHHYFIIV